MAGTAGAAGVGAAGTPDYGGLLAQQNAAMSAALEFQTNSSTQQIGYTSASESVKSSGQNVQASLRASNIMG